MDAELGDPLGEVEAGLAEGLAVAAAYGLAHRLVGERDDA
jgi:hypothetical protein